jgi:hypothetical protein
MRDRRGAGRCAGRGGRDFEQHDVTAAAAAAVAAVRAVRGKGTLGHVVDVLRGASTKAVRERGHDQLPEYGSGRDLRRAPAPTPHPAVRAWRRHEEGMGNLRSERMPAPTPGTRAPRSKGDVQRLLRRLVVAGVLLEDTFRQDNQYGGVVSCLRVAEPGAARLAAGALRVTLPFLAKARAAARVLHEG